MNIQREFMGTSNLEDMLLSVMRAQIDKILAFPYDETRDNREAIQRLLEDSKKKKFDIVIAKSVSRLGRKTVENLQPAHAIESMDIRLILPEDNYDTATSTSKLMFNLKAVLVEEESAKLSERIKIGLRASAREGVYKASLPAFGYKRDGKKLVLDEVYAPIVREIFDLYLNQDWGMYKISNYFISRGIPTPRTYQAAGTQEHYEIKVL